jgi:hypothetical protein
MKHTENPYTVINCAPESRFQNERQQKTDTKGLWTVQSVCCFGNAKWNHAQFHPIGIWVRKEQNILIFEAIHSVTMALIKGKSLICTKTITFLLLEDCWSSCFVLELLSLKRRDSSVGIALGYGMDDRGSMVRFPAGAGNFSLHHCVQNGSGTHSATYTMGNRVSFTGGKAAGAWSWPLTSI